MSKIMLNISHDETITIEKGPDRNIWLCFSQGSYSYPMTIEDATMLMAGLQHALKGESVVLCVKKDSQ